MDTLKRSRDLYQTGQIEMALIAVREACAQHPNNAEAWWLLGCVARHAGLVAVSDDGFRRASKLLPLQMPMPYRVTAEHFRALVEEAKRTFDDTSTTSPPITDGLNSMELRVLQEEAQRIHRDSVSARRWGIIVPGRAAAARLATEVVALPSLDAIRGGLSPDSRWRHEAGRVILYQVNHENVAGSDRDLVHVLVRSLVFAHAIARG
jgi:hypothetical protein